MTAFGDQARPRVFVYCDDPSHGGRVAVAAFCQSQSRWAEWRAGPARESGVTLVDSSRYRLECGKCGDHTAAVLDKQSLFDVLDVLDDQDLSHVTLSALAALAGVAS